MASPSTEQTIYHDHTVLVSTSRLIVNGATYPMSNVSSVRLLAQRPNYTAAVCLIVLGAIMLLSVLGGAGVTAGGIGFALLAIGVLIWRALKPTYTMLIGSAGGEKAALQSQDGPYMHGVVAAINDAIIARG